MTQQQIDERDRRWALSLMEIGLSPEDAARLLCRPVEFIDGAEPAARAA